MNDMTKEWVWEIDLQNRLTQIYRSLIKIIAVNYQVVLIKFTKLVEILLLFSILIFLHLWILENFDGFNLYWNCASILRILNRQWTNSFSFRYFKRRVFSKTIDYIISKKNDLTVYKVVMLDWKLKSKVREKLSIRFGF